MRNFLRGELVFLEGVNYIDKWAGVINLHGLFIMIKFYISEQRVDK